MDYGSAKSSGSVSESSLQDSSSGSESIIVDSSSGSLDIGDSSSGSLDIGDSSSGSESIIVDSSSGSLDIGDSSSGGSSSSVNDSSVSIGSSGEVGIFSYSVSGVVVISYEEGWAEGFKVEGLCVGNVFIRDNGETNGGLTCTWDTPATGFHRSQILGAYTTSESFNFIYYDSDAETSAISRRVEVFNTGTVDILVNSITVTPGTGILIENSSDVNPWGLVTATMGVSPA